MKFIITLRKHHLVTDVYLTLPPDSKKLLDITHGKRILEEGRDYFLDDKVPGKPSTITYKGLTIKADFLLSLPSHPLGEVAVLHINFEDGSISEVRIFQLDGGSDIDSDVGSNGGSSKKNTTKKDTTKNETAKTESGKKSKTIRLALGSAGILAVGLAAKLIMSRRKKK